MLNSYKIHRGGSRQTILSFFAVLYLPCHPILETSMINNSLNAFFWQSKLEIAFCIKCINMSNLGTECYIFAWRISGSLAANIFYLSGKYLPFSCNILLSSAQLYSTAHTWKSSGLLHCSNQWWKLQALLKKPMQCKMFQRAQNTSLPSQKYFSSSHSNLIIKFIFVSLILHIDKDALASWITGHTGAVLT